MESGKAPSNYLYRNCGADLSILFRRISFFYIYPSYPFWGFKNNVCVYLRIWSTHEFAMPLIENAYITNIFGLQFSFSTLIGYCANFHFNQFPLHSCSYFFLLAVTKWFICTSSRMYPSIQIKSTSFLFLLFVRLQLRFWRIDSHWIKSY